MSMSTFLGLGSCLCLGFDSMLMGSNTSCLCLGFHVMLMGSNTSCCDKLLEKP
jgi:hypothetical protein